MPRRAVCGTHAHMHKLTSAYISGAINGAAPRILCHGHHQHLYWTSVRAGTTSSNPNGVVLPAKNPAHKKIPGYLEGPLEALGGG